MILRRFLRDLHQSLVKYFSFGSALFCCEQGEGEGKEEMNENKIKGRRAEGNCILNEQIGLGIRSFYFFFLVGKDKDKKILIIKKKQKYTLLFILICIVNCVLNEQVGIGVTLHV